MQSDCCDNPSILQTNAADELDGVAILEACGSVSLPAMRRIVRRPDLLFSTPELTFVR